MRTNKTPMLRPRIRETKKTSSFNKSFICSRIKFQAGPEENIDTLVIVLITKNIPFNIYYYIYNYFITFLHIMDLLLNNFSVKPGGLYFLTEDKALLRLYNEEMGNT